VKHLFIFDLFVAFAVACLSGMGIGGGGLLVIWFILVRNIPPHAAQGLNLGFFIVSALCAYTHHRKKQRIPQSYLYTIIFSAAAGVFLGCNLAAQSDPAHAKQSFGWFLILCGTANLTRAVLQYVKNRRSRVIPKQV